MKPSSDADGLRFCSVDYRGPFSPLKCVKLFNFRLVEITNPSIYVCANCIVSYAKFMDRPARSTDSCAIHGFLRNVWIHRLRSAIHGLRRSTDCAQHMYTTVAPYGDREHSACLPDRGAGAYPRRIFVTGRTGRKVLINNLHIC